MAKAQKAQKEPKIVKDYKRQMEIEENCLLIRETQIDRSLKFPREFAPVGYLKQTGEHHYLQLMDYCYTYGKAKGGDEMILFLARKNTESSGKMERIKSVGEVFSVDLEWSEKDIIRIHLVAIEPCSSMVTSHYEVYDVGCAGVAFSVPKEAWENWRMWINAWEGIPIDKRMLYLALGDRDRIGNLSLEEFAKLDVTVIKQLLRNREAGQRMVRPSMEEAGLSTKKATPPPVIELDSSTSSSSTSGSEQRSPKTPKSGEKRKWLGSIMTRGRLQKMRSSPRSRTPPPSTSRNLFSKPGIIDDLTPMQREGISQLLAQCMVVKTPVPTSAGVKRAAEGFGRVDDEETSMEEASEVKDSDTMSCPDDFSPNCSGMFEFSMNSVSSSVGEVTSGSSPDILEEKVCRYEMLYGPLPVNDTIDLFLSKKTNDSQIVDVSTTESEAEVMSGKASDPANETNLW